MELKRALLAIAALLLLPVVGDAQQTQSTVQPNVPAVGAIVEQSGPSFRDNFQRVINDINALFGRPGVDQNLQNPQLSNYTVGPTDCGKTIVAGTGATGQFTITLPGAQTMPLNCSILIKNGDVTRGKILANFPGEIQTRLWPLQSIGVKRLGNVWGSFNISARWELGTFGGAQFYVDNVLGNDANDGLAPGVGAYRTWPGFIAVLASFIDSQSQTINVQLASGQSWSNFVVSGVPFGSGTIVLDLNGNTLTGTGGGVNMNALTVNSSNMAQNLANAVILVRNGTITCSGGGNGMVVVGGIAGIFDNITMGACPGGGDHFHVDSPLSRLIALSSYSVTGGATNHIASYNGGHLDFDTGSITVTLTGTPAFSNAFAWAINNSMIVSTAIFSGSATGFRYGATQGGIIQGSSRTYFPGSLDGLVTLGGVYASPGTPGVSGCGSSPGAPTGYDIGGHVTEGGTATGCTITFTTNNQPFVCTAQTNSATANAGLTVSTSPTALTVAHPSVSGAVLYWSCPSQGN